MKTQCLLVALALCCGVAAHGSTNTSAQGRQTPAAIAGSRKESAKPKGEEEKYVAHVVYEHLDEFINSEPYPPEPGEEFVVENAHMIERLGRDYGNGGKTFKGLYWLTADSGADIVTSFRAAADLAEALRPKLSTRPHHLRVECALVEVS